MPDVFIVPLIAATTGIVVALIGWIKDRNVQSKKRAQEREDDEEAARIAFQQAALADTSALRRELFEELRLLKHRDAVQQVALDAALDARREMGKRLEEAQNEAARLRLLLAEAQKRESALAVEVHEVRHAIGLPPSVPPPRKRGPT